MGIYSIFIGKGIIVTLGKLIEIFPEVKEKLKNGETIGELKIFNFQLVTLGHDAFQGRHGLLFDSFGTTENEASANLVLKYLEAEKENIEGQDNHQLIFIGFAEDLSFPDADMGYYLKAPEVIYSIAGFLPKLMKVYPILQEKDCNELEKMFGQKACIWTFADDCACCG